MRQSTQEIYGIFPGARQVGSPLQTWLSPVMSSAAPQPYCAKLVDSTSISAALAALLTVHALRPLSSASVTRLHRSYGPIRHLHGPTLALTRQSLLPEAIRPAPAQTSLVAHRFSCVRAITTTPVKWSGAFLARFPNRGGLPHYYGEPASAFAFWRPAQCSFSLRPARCTALLYRGLFMECFRPFVAS